MTYAADGDSLPLASGDPADACIAHQCVPRLAQAQLTDHRLHLTNHSIPSQKRITRELNTSTTLFNQFRAGSKKDFVKTLISNLAVGSTHSIPLSSPFIISIFPRSIFCLWTHLLLPLLCVHGACEVEPCRHGERLLDRQEGVQVVVLQFQMGDAYIRLVSAYVN